jgi:glutathione S-transferase
MRVPEGSLCESQVLLEYIEDANPGTMPLLPADPFARAKVRELVTFIELHLELVARRLYPQAFFGGTVEPSVIEATRKELERNVAAFSKLARFAPFVAGDTFTMADCSAIVSLPLISGATKAVLGADVLAATPARDYVRQMGERPSVQKVEAYEKEVQAQFAKAA